MNKPKILLVDDDVVSNFLFEKYIKELGKDVRIDVALNGKDGIRYLHECEDKFPALIFLDINMPMVNGFEFLEKYESEGFAGRSRIIMYTTSSEGVDEEKAYKYKDVKGFLTKPVQKDIILNTIDRLL